MTHPRSTAAALLAAAVLASAPAGAQSSRAARGVRPPLPASTLAVEDSTGAWRPWWRAWNAPARWSAGDTVLAPHARWTRVADGVQTAELRLAGSGEAWRTRAILVRLDPARVRLRVVQPARGADGWTVDDAPASALVAFNAGQFTGASPWGWVVRDGVERLSPGRGPIAPAIVVDGAGRVSLVASSAIPALRAGGTPRQAFQSYPALLAGDGEVPPALRAAGPDLDVAHRDARLAFGLLRDGRVLVVLTRFDALGGVLDRVPFGLTTPELAALMGALGCRDAVALDGGISAQLRVGGRAWPGSRRVPLGMIVEPR